MCLQRTFSALCCLSQYTYQSKKEDRIRFFLLCIPFSPYFWCSLINKIYICNLKKEFYEEFCLKFIDTFFIDLKIPGTTKFIFCYFSLLYLYTDYFIFDYLSYLASIYPLICVLLLQVSSEVLTDGCLIILDRDIKVKLRGTTYMDIDEVCLYLVIFFLNVRRQSKSMSHLCPLILSLFPQCYLVSVLMGTKRAGLQGESDDRRKFSVPPGFESLASFTLQRVENNEEACNSVAVGNESEQGPIQVASTSTIISIGKLKSSVRRRPWILDDHVDHMEEDSECEADKVSKIFIIFSHKSFFLFPYVV